MFLFAATQEPVSIQTIIENPTQYLGCCVFEEQNGIKGSTYFRGTKIEKIGLLCHGFGDAHDNFVSFARNFGIDNVLFIAPQAFYKIYALWPYHLGYGWMRPGHFGVASFLSVNKNVMIEDARAACDQLFNWIERDLKLDYTNLFICGFSLGACFAALCMEFKPELKYGIIVAGGSLNDRFILTDGFRGKHFLVINWEGDQLIERLISNQQIKKYVQELTKNTNVNKNMSDERISQALNECNIHAAVFSCATSLIRDWIRDNVLSSR